MVDREQEASKLVLCTSEFLLAAGGMWVLKPGVWSVDRVTKSKPKLLQNAFYQHKIIVQPYFVLFLDNAPKLKMDVL